MHQASVWDIPGWGKGCPGVKISGVTGISCPKTGSSLKLAIFHAKAAPKDFGDSSGILKSEIEECGGFVWW